MNTLAIIKEHGLAIRQIPKVVISLSDMYHFKPGDEVIEQECETMTPKGLKLAKINKQNYVVRDNKVFLKRAKTTRIPDHAGWWMCQPCNNTSAQMTWFKKTHHLAPTLEESIALYLANAKKS